MSLNLKINPRVALWLRVVGLTEKDIERVEPTEVRRVKVPGEVGETMWTIAFVIWSGRMWREWGNELGFRGDYGYEEALRSGFTQEQHWAWLEKRVERESQRASSGPTEV